MQTSRQEPGNIWNEGLDRYVGTGKSKFIDYIQCYLSKSVQGIRCWQ